MTVSCFAVNCTNLRQGQELVSTSFLLWRQAKSLDTSSFSRYVAKPSDHLCVAHFVKVDLPRTRMISISSQPSSKIRNETLEYPQSVAWGQKEGQEEWNRTRKAKMRSQLWTVWLAVLGKNSQQGVKPPSRMHLVRQILYRTYSLGGTCHCYSVLAAIGPSSMNEVRWIHACQWLWLHLCCTSQEKCHTLPSTS